MVWRSDYDPFDGEEYSLYSLSNEAGALLDHTCLLQDPPYPPVINQTSH